MTSDAIAYSVYSCSRNRRSEFREWRTVAATVLRLFGDPRPLLMEKRWILDGGGKRRVALEAAPCPLRFIAPRSVGQDEVALKSHERRVQ